MIAYRQTLLKKYLEQTTLFRFATATLASVLFVISITIGFVSYPVYAAGDSYTMSVDGTSITSASLDLSALSISSLTLTSSKDKPLVFTGTQNLKTPNGKDIPYTWTVTMTDLTSSKIAATSCSMSVNGINQICNQDKNLSGATTVDVSLYVKAQAAKATAISSTTEALNAAYCTAADIKANPYCTTVIGNAANDCLPSNIVIDLNKNPIAIVNTFKAGSCIATAIGKPSADVQQIITANAAKMQSDITNSFGSLDKQKECLANGDTWSGGVCTPKPTSDSKTTCSPDIGPMGWIICPVVNLLATGTDQSFGIIKMFLETSPKLTTDAGTVKAWEAFRNIANIFFVIAFMIIVFSQVTSVGIGNYGIKKLLPRLIIAAILVNASLIVCQLAVDLSNILGNSLSSLLDGLVPGVSVNAATGTGFMAFFGNVLTGVGIAVGVVVLILCVSVPVLVAVLLSVVMIVAILIARNAIVLLLIIVAPVAFVAYLLPNTEDLFKKWYKMFYGLLLVYPIIGLLYGGGKLASKILASGTDWTLQLAAMAAAGLPLALTPMVLKGSLKATGELGSKLQGLSNKADGRIGKKVGDSRFGDINKYREQQRAVRSANARAGVSTRRKGGKLNPANWANSASASLNSLTNKVLPGKVTSGYEARASSLKDQEFNDKVKEASIGIGEQSAGDVLKKFHTMDEAQQAAAIEHIMAKGSFNERRQLVEASGGFSGENAAKLRKRVSDGVYAKGDQNIYGAGIGAQITSGGVTGEDSLRQFTQENIEGGHVSAEHVAQGEGSLGYMTDVALGQKTGKDSAGNTTRVNYGTASAGAQAELKAASSEAKRNSGTRAKVVGTAFSGEFARIP